MAYVLRGGPRDRQLVDDLPIGYRAVGDASPEDGVRVQGMPFDAAEWMPSEARIRTTGPVSSPPRLTAL